LEKLFDVTQNAVVRQGWAVNGRSQEAWNHRYDVTPNNQGFISFPEAGAILVGFFGQLGTVESTVCIRLYNPFLFGDHHSINQCIR